jgi:hypothetical protein
VIGYSGAPRYAQAIQALTGDDELVPPGLILEDDRDTYSFLKRERLWVGFGFLAASVGNFSSFTIGTAGTDVLEELLGLFADQQVRVGIRSTAGFAFSVQCGPTDGRQGSVAASIFTRQTTQVLNANPVWNVPITTIVSTRNGTLPPFIATAGFGGIVIESIAANTAVNLFIWGRERQLRPEEKSV